MYFLKLITLIIFIMLSKKNNDAMTQIKSLPMRCEILIFLL